MEISSSPPLTDLERENMVSWHDQEVEEVHYPESQEMQQPSKDQQEDETTGEGENGERDGDECDYLVFDTGLQKEEINTGESEGGQKIKEGGGKEDGDGGRGETDRENESTKQVATENGSTESPDCGTRETGEEDEGAVKNTSKDQGIKGTKGEDGESGDSKDMDKCVEDVKTDALEEFLFISKSPACHETANLLDPAETPAATVLQEAWGEDPANPDDLSDCLQAELAIVYSDSDAGEDQWAAFSPREVRHQEEKREGICDSVCDGESKEEERGEKNEERAEEEGDTDNKREEEAEKEEKREGMHHNYNDNEEQMRMRRDVFLRSLSVSSTASSTDPDRKVPVDFCVQQDALSENVSTEHVDFVVARQQWKKMEEEVRGQPIPKPGLRAQGSFQGTHTSLYPPARSPRLKHREIHPPVPREPPLSSTMSPNSEDSGLDDSSYRSPLEEPETAVEREIRLTLEREERHRRERGMIAQGLTIPRPTTLQTGRSPPRPPACRTPTLSISPSPSSSSSLSRSVYHEMTANNVIILEPDCSGSRNRVLSTAISSLSDWPASLDPGPSANVIVVETSNLIIRSASEFCLSSAPVSMETQESTFSSNPFFKLRSLSSQSLVEQEIRMVRQREEEWRKQREEMWRRRREEEWRRGREKYDTVLVSPGLNDSISYNVPEVSDRSVSSPSSPSRTRKMERSSLSCDHKFPPSLSSAPRRQNAMAQRWEASLLANQKKE